MSMDMVLLVLCLWSCVATGLAIYYFRHYFVLKLVCIALGKELLQVARGDLKIEMVNNEIQRTYKEKQHA